jgi:hypothetical protein
MPLAAQIAALESNAAVGSCHFDEQGLEATRSALSAPVIDRADDPRHPEMNDGNVGFLREDAHLAVLVHSDEVDQSPDTTASYARFLLALKDDPAQVRFHAIVGERATGCNRAGTAAQRGDRYLDVVDATGGAFHSFCDQGPTEAFNEALAYEMITRRCYALADRPADADGSGAVEETPPSGGPPELQVRIDGQRVPSRNSRDELVWSYDAAGNQVCFTEYQLPEPGPRIEITYGTACLPPSE